MKRTHDVWSNGKQIRILTPYMHDNGLVSIRRLYTDTSGSNRSFDEIIDLYTTDKIDGLAYVTKTFLSCTGRELWDKDITIDHAKSIIDRFRKSALKHGFDYYGKVETVYGYSY